ncbi:Multi-sensor Hybrid Histidine Kinase (fragment) [Rhizobium mesoamericanum STM3625]|uniref:Multi-sensor Hybrid Histidine Kinase n=1 Tax=Rhizobium mesoamericanum STM3625 TaxID=1211777 RepID=K0PNA0_9HYPH
MALCMHNLRWCCVLALPDEPLEQVPGTFLALVGWTCATVIDRNCCTLAPSSGASKKGPGALSAGPLF